MAGTNTAIGFDKRISRRSFLTGAAKSGLVLGAVGPLLSCGTTPSSSGPTTLVVQNGDASDVGRIPTFKRINKAFEKAHPNVTVKMITEGFTQLTTTLNLQLSGSNVPDVTQVNQGYESMGILVKGGLLRPLDEYASKFGWLKRQPQTLLADGMFTPDGKNFGSGNLYGISATGDVVGVYYNKSKLVQLGLSVPTSFSEFENALAIAKSAGEIPIAFGDLDKSPGIHDFQAVQNVLASKTYQNDFVFNIGNLSFATAPNEAAAATVQDWSRKGYFSPGFLDLGYNTWVSGGFGHGQGVFCITGNWFNSTLAPIMGSNLGFFLMPEPGAGEPSVATGSGGLPWSIPSKAAHPDLAAEYIDFMTGPEAALMLLENGDLPSYALSSAVAPSGTAAADVIAAWKQLIDNDNFVPFLDWSTTTLYNTLAADVQVLLANRMTPRAFVNDIEANVRTFRASSSG